MGFFGKYFRASWAKKNSQKSAGATCARRPGLVLHWQLTRRTQRLQAPAVKMRRQRGRKLMAEAEAIWVVMPLMSQRYAVDRVVLAFMTRPHQLSLQGAT